MIEINLLPNEYRKVEGTPVPRLAAIVAGVALFATGAVVLLSYHLVHIPKLEAEIKTLENTKKANETALAEKAAIDKKKSELEAKLNALASLENSRVLWARVLLRFREAIPDYVVVKSFSVAPQAGGAADSGKRYAINASLLIGGDSTQDINNRLDLFRVNLRREFGIPQTEPPPTTAPRAPGALPPGYDPWLRLRFEPPDYPQQTPVAFPPLAGPEPDRFKKPAQAMNVTLTLVFSLPPPQAVK